MGTRRRRRVAAPSGWMKTWSTISVRSPIGPAARSATITLINLALRNFVEGRTPKWEATPRRIIREEMARNSAA